jgi:hypothetical protein
MTTNSDSTNYWTFTALAVVDEDDASEYPDYKNCSHDFPFMNLTTKGEGEKKNDAFNFDRYRPMGAFAIMCNACHKRYTDEMQHETI